MPRGAVKMQRRHFKLIADTVCEASEVLANCHDLTPAGAKYLREVFADALSSTNPNFDRATFLAACMPLVAGPRE